MSMERIAISEFKATCCAVLERVRKTRLPVLVTRRGEPVPQVMPPPETTPAEGEVFGCMAGTAEITGDIVAPGGTADWESVR